MAKVVVRLARSAGIVAARTVAIGLARSTVTVKPIELPARLDADSAWALGEALAPLAVNCDDPPAEIVVGSAEATRTGASLARMVTSSSPAQPLLSIVFTV